MTTLVSNEAGHQTMPAWFQQSSFEQGSGATSVIGLSPLTEETQRQAVLLAHIASVYENPLRSLGIIRTFSGAGVESIATLYSYLRFEEVYISLCESLRNISQSIWSETNTSATLLFESYMQWLENQYVASDKTALRHFIAEHPSLAQLLVAAYTNIKVHFPDACVFLDIVTDYEDAENQPPGANPKQEIVLSIGTSLSPKDAIVALHNFYEEWWFGVSQDAEGIISIGLEFL
jgi:hypothetical protein